MLCDVEIRIFLTEQFNNQNGYLPKNGETIAFKISRDIWVCLDINEWNKKNKDQVEHARVVSDS